MRRAAVLIALVTVGGLSIAVSALQQPPGSATAPRVVEVQKLKDNMFILTGGGGNTTVFIQGDGITVVDTKNPGWGQPILSKIKELSPKPVVRIINTHTHGDHVSGNVEFPATVDIVVQENTAANMKLMKPVTAAAAPPKPAPTIFEQNQGKGLAKRTFKDKMTIGSGADQIDLFYFGRGHTNGDAWVLFPALRVVSIGDIFASNNQLPLLDTNNGGSGVEIGDTLMKGHAALNKLADQIVTGHSSVMTFDDLRRWAEFNRGFLEQMRAAKKAGKTPEQTAKEWKAPAGFQPQDTPAAQTRLAANVQSIYNEIK
jgi:glyoxylase-like metal-dependent hydrolase (beta-lactamase superfamily II)